MSIEQDNYKEFEMSLRRDGMSGVIVKRIMRLAREFANLESFFTASKGDLMKAYVRIAPKSKHGLGNSFWLKLERATRIYRGTADSGCDGRTPEEPKFVEEPKIAKDALRMMKLEELKTIVAFMELCDVEAINVAEIVGFLDAVRMRQKKPEEGSPANTQEPA